MGIPIYVGKTYKAYRAGSSWVCFQCEKCGCRYGHDLNRLAVGVHSTHYGIGEAEAPANANKAAEENLKEQLEKDAELVPCPKCFWIDESAVEKYRNSNYGGCAFLLLILTFAATPLCIWIGWFIWRGPLPDRGDASLWMIYIPVGLWCTTIASFVITSFFKNRFNPNWNYPSRPKVPTGTPKAFLVDDDGNPIHDGKDEPHDGAAEDEGHLVIMSPADSSLPPVCCYCLCPCESTLSIVLPKMAVEVPCCSECRKLQFPLSTHISFCGFYAMVLLALIIVTMMLTSDVQTFSYIAYGSLLVVAVAAVHYCVLHVQIGIVRLNDFDSIRGVTTLWFQNEDYVSLVHRFRKESRR